MNKERERQILEIMLRDKKASVKDLAKKLYTSEPSIRRDLASLEKQQLLKRVHGGALLPSCFSLIGAEACRMIESYNADIAFFSCRGLSADGKATDYFIEETLVRQKND